LVVERPEMRTGERVMQRKSEADIPQPALRQQAEAVLRHIPQETANLSEPEFERLSHELQVHQVELELQNEELRCRQEELQIARDQYAVLYDFAPVGYLTLDPRGTILAANLTAAEQLGVDRDALRQTPLARFLVRDDQDTFYLHRRQVFEVDTLQTCDLRLQRSDGTVLVVSLESRRVQDVAGQGYQCFTTLSDITARKQAEHALRQSEARMRSIVETAVDGIITLNEQGGIESFNPAAERIFGYRAAEVIGKNVTLLMPSPYREEHEAYLARYLRTGERQIIGIGREVVGKRREGTTFPMDLSVGETYVGTQRIFTGIVRDISERKRAAEELQRSDRLALVGQLASGLAHEIGTPLNVIAGNSELLRMDLQAQQMPTETVEVIIHQTDRITGLVQQLLNFARSEQRVKRPFSLCAPLEDALCLLETHFQRDVITVTRDIPDDLPPLWGVADQIEQVFLNVLVNAWHAMPTGGTLTITARETADKLIRVTFRDTGAGMVIADLKRAFEPFYTTKGHNGTGLGLSICKQIIENHQGNMTLESTPGAGTTVRLDLVCALRLASLSTSIHAPT
jgi:PAS domain S-box-containing protein